MSEILTDLQRARNAVAYLVRDIRAGKRFVEVISGDARQSILGDTLADHLQVLLDAVEIPDA